MRKHIFLLALSSLLLSFACTSEDSSASDNSAIEAAPTSSADQQDNASTATADNNEVFSWVENLNIRQQPDMKSKVVAMAKENESLTLTGKKTDQTETIELRGKSYTEPWVEVKTADGTTGWVFGGAVKKAGEDKGNALNTATQFTLPHFGYFDLSEWRKLASRNDSENSELEVLTDVYQKGNQTLEISTSDMGEFYWGKTYKLLDASKKVLKERSISFSTDPFTLTETVKDFGSRKQYSRSNELKTYPNLDKSKPILATGNWTTSDLTTKSAGNTSSAKRLGFLAPGECGKHVEQEFNCACNFREGDPFKGSILFESNLNDKACVKVDGQTNALYPDWEERYYVDELNQLSTSSNWITVRNDEITYFGKPLAFYKYADPVDLLTDVILASKKARNDIPIQTTTGGPAVETAKAQAAKAIAKAKASFAIGMDDPITIFKFDNRSYDVIVRVRRTTAYDGGANLYEGTITLLNNRTTEILETRAIKGTCGC